ncbi:hypothetical protein [Nesterenkonia rhizosphaerae]|uniref:Uncharacterized protein n=1 Tax=Nesterenkonia rhizosphaerae TaxID=1348272 RepID=A0ABP9G017_9MICC
MTPALQPEWDGLPDLDDDDQQDSQALLPDLDELEDAEDDELLLPDLDDLDDPMGAGTAPASDPLYAGAPDYLRSASGLRLGEQAPKPATGQHQRRLDPYYAGMWERGSHVAWDSAQSLRDRCDASSIAYPEGFRPDSKAAITHLRSQPAKLYVAMLSVLDSWGIVTAQQMAAFTGYRQLASPSDQVVMDLFSAGLIQIGRMQYAFNMEELADQHTAYRLVSRRAIRRVFGRSWTSAEYLQCDGGQFRWPMTGYLDRHNILAAEVALRAAESLSACSTVLGEKWCNGQMMFPEDYATISGRERNPIRPDAAIMLRNGLRVLVELQASASAESFNKKIQRYATMMMNKPLDETGLVVVFVSAPAKTSTAASHEYLQRHLYHALKNWPARGEDSPGQRIGFAKWEDWFTPTGELTESFHDLNVVLPAASRVSSLVEMDGDFTPHTGVDLSAPLRTAPVLAGTPWWLRQGDHTPLISAPSAVTGYGSPTPEKHLVMDSGAIRSRVRLPARLRAEGRKTSGQD